MRTLKWRIRGEREWWVKKFEEGEEEVKIEKA